MAFRIVYLNPGPNTDISGGIKIVFSPWDVIANTTLARAIIGIERDDKRFHEMRAAGFATAARFEAATTAAAPRTVDGAR